MLDRQLLRNDPERVRAGALKKGIDAPIDRFLEVDKSWRAVRAELESKQAEMNRQQKEIGAMMALGKREEADVAKEATRTLKEQLAGLNDQEKALEATLLSIELDFPNLPHDDVPAGRSEAENVVVREHSDVPGFMWEPEPHWDIASRLGMIDFARGAKISGSGFILYTGLGARLQRSLFNFMIDHQVDCNGYREIYPPYIVNSASLKGTGQLPKFEEDLFKVSDDHYLIPTAEVPVTNIYRDEILEGWQLPMKMAAFSGCFRKEAGAAGKDTRGIQRLHQFDKVELVKYSLPENSYEELESLTLDAESILKKLGLHYRVVLLCAGEMSATNCKCYDIELWSPGLGKYLEVSSCSNFEDFQARRAGIRFRRGQGEKPEFVHILNGSGVATPRLLSAIIETYYEPGKGIHIPEPLRHYMHTDWIPEE